MTQPTAMRLADALDAYHTAPHHKQAAAELRHLHAENTELREENAELRAWFEVESGQLKRAVVAEREMCDEMCDAIDRLVGAIESVGISNAGAKRVLGKACEDALKCADAIRARGPQ